MRVRVGLGVRLLHGLSVARAILAEASEVLEADGVVEQKGSVFCL